MTTRLSRFFTCAAVLLSAAFLPGGAAAQQAYPQRPIRIVIPWPPGQATDLAARVIGQKLNEMFEIGRAHV